ncbi:cell wall-binding repeat-containing protein [Herbiconiux liukaitaii]|uniref:cell wall-binding repeat-containing protein n=1 Tax=Herbiconiux liukaitaii TaxID=3342799 RepID=UPI0035B74826
MGRLSHQRISALAVFLAAGVLLGGAAPSTSGASPAPVDDEGHRLTADVSRISGADRYELAARIARQTAPGRSDVVYIASGATYPDALSAGPAVVHRGGVLLLVPPTSLPASVSTALAALDPSTVVVVGGTASVPDAVVSAIRSTVPRATVSRLAGADRYEVSRAVARSAFDAPTSGVFLATGRTFPDALSAGAAASKLGFPVLLVDGAQPALDGSTAALITELGAGSAIIMGGTASVTASIEASIGRTLSTTRVGGADRYAVSAALNDLILQDYSTVYLATGATFPDALAGGVLAGSTNAPLFVIPNDCIPKAVVQQLEVNGTRKIVLLGGPASLGDAVAALTPCTW